MPSWSPFIRSLLKGTAIPKALKFLPACGEGADEAQRGARERTSVPQGAIFTPETVLYSHQPNASELTCTPQMVSGSSTFMPHGIAVCHTAGQGCAHTRALLWIRSGFCPTLWQSHLRVQGQACFQLQLHQKMHWITNGNSAPWDKTSQHILFPCANPSCCTAPAPSRAWQPPACTSV